MYKDGQTFGLGLFISLLHKTGSSALYFCVVLQLLESYENKRFRV